jgi:type II secretory pathway component GspD/PulD (secretin)
MAMVPFIGALFGRHAREVDDNQAYMLIVPSVVEPVSMVQRDRVEEALRAYERFQGGVDSQHLMDDPRVGRRGEKTE